MRASVRRLQPSRSRQYTSCTAPAKSCAVTLRDDRAVPASARLPSRWSGSRALLLRCCMRLCRCLTFWIDLLLFALCRLSYGVRAGRPVSLLELFTRADAFGVNDAVKCQNSIEVIDLMLQ